MDKADLFRLHHQWIADCEASDKLTEWEVSFLASIKKFLDDKGSLTPKQVEVLERIYASKSE